MPKAHLLIGPPGDATREKFFSRVIERCADANRVMAFHYIVPTARRRAEVESAVERVAIKRGALWWPRIETLDRLAQQLFSKTNSAHLIPWRVAGLVIESILTKTPDDFPKLLGNRAVPQSGLVGEALRTLRELKRSAHISKFKTQSGDGPIAAEMAELARRYTAELETRGWVDAQDVLWHVGQHLAEPDRCRDVLAGIDWIVFDGFVEFSPAEVPIVRAVTGAVETTCVFDTDSTLDVFMPPLPSFKTRPTTRQHAGPFVSTARVALGAPTVIDPGHAPVRLCESPTREEEVAQIAAAVKRLLLDGASPRDIAVAVPTWKSYESLLEHTFAEHGIPYRPTRQVPLAESPLTTAFFLLLQAPAGDFTRLDVVRLFESPFVQFEGTPIDATMLNALARTRRIFRTKAAWLEGLREQIADRAHRLAAPSASDDETDEECAECLERDSAALQRLEGPFEQALAALDALREPRSASQYADAALDLIERFGLAAQARALPDRRGTFGAHLPVLSELRRALDESALFDELHGHRTLSLAAFIERLRTTVAETLLNPSDRSDGIEILDFRTAVERRTRHLIVAGLVEGAVPVARPRDVLLPSAVRTRLGLPNAEWLANEARVELYRVLASADQTLTLTRPLVDGETPLLRPVALERLVRTYGLTPEPPSTVPISWRALLCRLGTSDPQRPSLDELQRHVAFRSSAALAAFAHTESVRHARNDGAAPSPYTGYLSPGLRDAIQRLYPAEYQFSASELELYARCPFRFFSKYVLGLAHPEEPEEAITPLDKGNVLHAVFRDFYRAWLAAGHRAITLETLDEALILLKQTAEAHLAKLPYSGRVWEKFRERLLGHRVDEHTVVPGLFEQFLQVEQTTSGPKVCTPRHFEIGFGRQRHGGPLDEQSNKEPLPIESGDRRILLHGIIDRIDTNDAERTFTVLDYKTGSKIPTKEEVDKGPSLQIPVYVMAAHQLLGSTYDFAAAGYFQIKDAKDCKKQYRIRNTSQASGNVPKNQKARSFEPAEVNDWLDEERRRLVDYVLGIEAGEFPVTSFDDEQAQCRSCDFKHICHFAGITLNTFGGNA